MIIEILGLDGMGSESFRIDDLGDGRLGEMEGILRKKFHRYISQYVYYVFRIADSKI